MWLSLVSGRSARYPADQQAMPNPGPNGFTMVEAAHGLGPDYQRIVCMAKQQAQKAFATTGYLSCKDCMQDGYHLALAPCAEYKQKRRCSHSRQQKLCPGQCPARKVTQRLSCHVSCGPLCLFLCLCSIVDVPRTDAMTFYLHRHAFHLPHLSCF